MMECFLCQALLGLDDKTPHSPQATEILLLISIFATTAEYRDQLDSECRKDSSENSMPLEQ
jgi:hypothetical protein